VKKGVKPVSELKLKILEFAKKCGADLVGFSDIGRFSCCEKRNHPFEIYPETKTVIGLAFRMLRGSSRGIEEGSTYYQYYTTAVETIEEVYMPKVLLQVAGLIEDYGYDAVVQKQYQLIMDEADQTNPEVRYSDIYRGIKGEYQLDFKKSAVLCGMGELGLSGSVLTDEFGPFQRFAYILTNAEIAPDAIKAANICDQCGLCISSCPGKAFGEGMAKVNCGEMGFELKELDKWQCAAYYKGANGHYNPFMPPDVMQEFEDRDEILNGDKRMGLEETKKVMDQLVFYPPGRHSYVPSICGRACDRACYFHLESAGRLKRKFVNQFRPRAPWRLEISK
jgi:epoxyqueuosine reductase